MAFSKIRPRGDTKSKWEAANPVLLEREIGVEWENTIGVGEVNIKLGDGVKHWNELDYAVVSDIKKKIISSFAEVTAENPELEEGSTLDLLWAVTKKKFEYLNTQVNGIKTMIGAFSNITVESGGVEQAAADITTAVQLLNSGKLSTADIYNGLDSTNALLALSAAQGRELKNGMDKLNGDLSSLKTWSTEEFRSIGGNVPAIYGSIIRIRGTSSPNIAGSDTYYICNASNGKLHVGLQVNGADNVTWHTMVGTSDLVPVDMTKTRTENPYVSETAFNRIIALKIGPNLVWVDLNLMIDSSPLPTTPDFIEIGKIDGISSVKSGVRINIPAQNGSGTILFAFEGAGILKIYNNSSSGSVSGFVRSSFVAVVNFN